MAIYQLKIKYISNSFYFTWFFYFSEASKYLLTQFAGDPVPNQKFFFFLTSFCETHMQSVKRIEQ